LKLFNNFLFCLKVFEKSIEADLCTLFMLYLTLTKLEVTNKWI